MKQQYDSYKPSGIDWIGDIPSYWVCIKTLHALAMPITDGPHETPQLYDCGIPFISAEAISSGEIRFENMRGYISEEFYNQCCKKYIPQRNDIYMTKSGASTGRVALVNTDEAFTIWSPLAAFRANNEVTDYKYLYYVLRSECYQKQVENGWSFGTQQNIGMRTLERLKIPFPPLKEQLSIANWLDAKCGKIDAAIVKVEREIELIDELKQSEISRVVTRGLNPEAPMRPSGIDWIGDIPEHWTKCRLKFIGSARNGLTYSPSDVKDSGKLVIRSSNIQDAKLNYDDCVFVANYPETLSVNSGDTIICSRNGSINLIGKSVFIEDDMDVTFGAFMMRFRPYEHPKYSHYLLSIAISQYKGLFATTTINQLTADSLGKMEAVMPPYMEQVQIADYLDKKCAEIDGLKANLTKKRETLTELRQSIISEVVTGKQKVI